MNLFCEEKIKVFDVVEWSVSSKLFKRYETDKVPIVRQDKDSNNDKVFFDHVIRICDSIDVLDYLPGRVSDDARERALKMLSVRLDRFKNILDRFSVKSVKAS